MSTELAGLAWSTASKVAEERDKLREIINEIDAVLRDDPWFSDEALDEIDKIIDKVRA